MIKAGDKVTGTKFEVEYSGTVEMVEGYELDWNYTRFYINLDFPISFFGATRRSIVILALNNSPANGLSE